MARFGRAGAGNRNRNRDRASMTQNLDPDFDFVAPVGAALIQDIENQDPRITGLCITGPLITDNRLTNPPY